MAKYRLRKMPAELMIGGMIAILAALLINLLFQKLEISFTDIATKLSAAERQACYAMIIENQDIMAYEARKHGGGIVFSEFAEECMKGITVLNSGLMTYSEEERNDNVLKENVSLNSEQDEEKVVGEYDWEKFDRIASEENADQNAQENKAVGVFSQIIGKQEEAGPMPEQRYLPVKYLEKTNLPKLAEILEHPSSINRVPFVGSQVLIENHYPMEKLADPKYLLSEYYIVDSVTSAPQELFQAEKLLTADLTIDPEPNGYQILIYHTHGTEAYADSRAGEEADTVRGAGEELAKELRALGYTVYHDRKAYDWKDGHDNRNYAYSTALPYLQDYLTEHPETRVVIDLHRDSGARRVTEIDGKQTAQVMLFNGMCRNESGPIDYLDNPHLESNLALSLQLNLTGRVLYPGLMYRIYLKNYRYNQHLTDHCLLIELGTDQNTVEEAYNAMKPLAEVLDAVLRKDDN